MSRVGHGDWCTCTLIVTNQLALCIWFVCAGTSTTLCSQESSHFVLSPNFASDLGSLQFCVNFRIKLLVSVSSAGIMLNLQLKLGVSWTALLSQNTQERTVYKGEK